MKSPLFLLIALIVSQSSFSQSIPVLGDSWKITGLPNVPIEIGRQNVDVVDHSFFKRADGKWVVVAAIRGAIPSHPLYAWETNKLTDPNWKEIGVVASADSAYGEDTEKGLYAPHILKKPNGYYCFYTTANSMRALFSKDGFNFMRIKDKEGHYEIINHLVGRDVMVFEESGKYYAYSTVSTFDAGGWPSGYIVATFAKFQDDYMFWPHPEYSIVNSGGIGGNGAVSCESPFVLKYDGDYYLFRASSKTFKTYVYRSKNLLDFGVNNDSKLIAVLPLKASEILEENGQWYISDLDDFKGLKMHRFSWVKESVNQSKIKSKRK
ncbi:MAG: family 43 glycosylhydrolase [Bacteroidales bacterium]|nr:family 43 glycosylhydrolase [Bacteroidales bacterium]